MTFTADEIAKIERAAEEKAAAKIAAMPLADRVARMLCEWDGLEPDTLVTNQMPYMHRAGYQIIPRPDVCAPAWHFYRMRAKAAVDMIKAELGKVPE